MVFNLITYRNNLRRFFSEERKSGIKSSHYFYNFEREEVMCMDTQSEFEEQVEVYKKQGIELYKEILLTNKTCISVGCKKGVIKVFRNDKIVWNELNPDVLSMSLGYLPSYYELVTIKIIL